MLCALHVHVHINMLYYIRTYTFVCTYVVEDNYSMHRHCSIKYVGVASHIRRALTLLLTSSCTSTRVMHYFVVTHKSSISNAHGQIFNVMEHT